MLFRIRPRPLRRRLCSRPSARASPPGPTRVPVAAAPGQAVSGSGSVAGSWEALRFEPLLLPRQATPIPFCPLLPEGNQGSRHRVTCL